MLSVTFYRMINMKTIAIIAAAGSGSRMKSGTSKQFIELNGIPVLIRTLLAFDKAEKIDGVIIVTRKTDIETVKDMVKTYGIKKVLTIAVGGETRQDSVSNALKVTDSEYVLIHDGARPFITSEQINSVASALSENDAAALGKPVTDTLKIVKNGYISGTQERASLYGIQTPQGFKTSVIKDAHKAAKENGLSVTDDCALCEHMGIKIKIIEGSSSNIKITTPDDLPIAMGILNSLEGRDMRIGSGYDVHQLVENRPLIMGGVNIPYELGLLGHSDADVLLHAIMDAMLGAAALGDIGKHFPDTDAKWKGADSMKLLEAVNILLKSNGYSVHNIDATIIAQKPKMAEFIPQMRENVASTLGISIDFVNIKATTTEKLGFCGRGEGIAAEAVCTIK